MDTTIADNGTRTVRISPAEFALVDEIATAAKLSQRDIVDRLVQFGADKLRARLVEAGLIART